MNLKKWWSGKEVKAEFDIETPDLLSLIYDGTLRTFEDNLKDERTVDRLKNEIMPRAFGYRDELVDSLPIPSEDVEALRVLDDKQSDQDPKTVIENLIFSASNNVEITIKSGRKSVNYGFDVLGFREPTTNEWEALLEIVRAPFPVFSIGPAKDKNPYNAKIALLRSLNGKLVSFLKKEFGLTLPKGFKVHHLDKAMPPGTYKFLFQTASSQQDTNEEAATLEQLQRLSEMYKNTSDKTDRQRTFTSFVELGNKAVSEEWITEEEMGLLIRTEDDYSTFAKPKTCRRYEEPENSVL